MTQGGQQRPKITTKDWSLKGEWKERPKITTKGWSLKEVVEYVVASKIDDEPAFKWWIHYALRERKSIISK
eukprot:9503639-Ditylum_brightwellii.AAC.1